MPDETTNLATRPLPSDAEIGEPRFARLQVTAGPDQGAQVTVETIQPNPLLVGQSAACELRLTDPGISRRHLALAWTNGELIVRDLDSTNGTRIDGVRVTEAMVEDGQIVRIGSSELTVRFEAPERKVVLPAQDRFGRLLGRSTAMRRLYPLCRKLAASDVPVVIEGETGTGKEVLAEALHEEGPNPQGPFVVFDCTTVASGLIESALFGHEKGAFTGATEMRRGVFEQADGGTLLLDEIGDLGLDLQAKLLRAIERKRIQRVGGRSWIDVDVRVLSATRRDLDREVQQGRFRDDLFFRLAVTRIELPPLRQRKGDVELLARSFWSRLSRHEPDPPAEFLRRLADYAFPGNVRELHNAVARQVALGDWGLGQGGGDERASDADEPPANAALVDAKGDIPLSLTLPLDLDVPLPLCRRRVVQAFERAYLTRLLERHGGNIAEAAEASGVARRYFRLLRAKHRDP